MLAVMNYDLLVEERGERVGPVGIKVRLAFWTTRCLILACRRHDFSAQNMWSVRIQLEELREAHASRVCSCMYGVATATGRPYHTFYKRFLFFSMSLSLVTWSPTRRDEGRAAVRVEEVRFLPRRVQLSFNPAIETIWFRNVHRTYRACTSNGLASPSSYFHVISCGRKRTLLYRICFRQYRVPGCQRPFLMLHFSSLPAPTPRRYEANPKCI
jgi:hypothetical protein